MPFEVYPIKPPVHETNDREGVRDLDDVAQDIKAAYTNAAEQGGKIVAEHHVSQNAEHAYNRCTVRYLFLVAEIPEVTDTTR